MRSMLDDILENVLKSDGSEFTIYNPCQGSVFKEFFFLVLGRNSTTGIRSWKRLLLELISLMFPTRVPIIAKGDSMEPHVCSTVCACFPKPSSNEEGSDRNLAQIVPQSHRTRLDDEWFNLHRLLRTQWLRSSHMAIDCSHMVLNIATLKTSMYTHSHRLLAPNTRNYAKVDDWGSQCFWTLPLLLVLWEFFTMSLITFTLIFVSGRSY